MRIIRDLSHIPASAKGAALALGNFDGVHLGHQAILQSCVESARDMHIPSAAMTFEPHPRQFFARVKGQQGEALRIYPLRRKIELIKAMGLDTLFIARFNARFASISADAFIQNLLMSSLGVKHVVTGYNFAFGSGRSGNAELLAGKARGNNFSFTAVNPVVDKAGNPVSSTAIRAALKEGNLALATSLLGKPYCITGHVIHGDKRGRTIGYPTANIPLERLFKPRFGVYAARVSIGDLPGWHDAVMNIGIRPSFSKTDPVLEVHLFDMNTDLYGKRLHVEPVAFLRDERAFDGIEALKNQIAADAASARQLLKTGAVA